METLNLIGGAWLAGRYGLNLVTPLAVQSRIGGRRRTSGLPPFFCSGCTDGQMVEING